MKKEMRQPFKFRKWAVIITGCFLLFITSASLSLTIALMHPVEFDSSYEEPLDYLKDNFDIIQRREREFDAKFDVKLLDEPVPGKNEFRFSVTDRQGNPFDGATLKLLVTRGATNKQDTKVEKYTVSNGVYSFQQTDLPGLGKWILNLRIEADGIAVNKHFPFEFKIEKDLTL